MTKALKGNNRKHQEGVEGECYITPRWPLEWLLTRWQPRGRVICDPCACGVKGWTLGGHAAQVFGLEAELFDLNPQHSTVARADFRKLRLTPALGGRTILTNGPYSLLPELVKWGLECAEEVVVLCRYGYLCAVKPGRSEHLEAYYQPKKRLAFELLPEEGERRLKINRKLEQELQAGTISQAQYEKRVLSVVVDPRTVTGYRMAAVGVDHGWAVFRRGYEGDTRLVFGHPEEEPSSLILPSSIREAEEEPPW